MRRRALIVSGGPRPGRHLRASLPEPTWAIAADSGVDVCQALGLVPTHVVGDLDSVTATGLAWARAAGAHIQQHPRDKDATDLELALDLALELGAEEGWLVGGQGGRLDHLLGNVGVLAAPRYAALQLGWLGDRARGAVVRGARALPMEAGATFSVIAWGGVARVSIRGARWTLEAHALSPFRSRGVSNEAVGEVVVTVHDGVALVLWEAGLTGGS